LNDRHTRLHVCIPLSINKYVIKNKKYIIIFIYFLDGYKFMQS